MSNTDIEEEIKKFNDSREKEIDLDKKRKDLQEKKILVDSYKYDYELAKINKNEEDLKRVQEANVGILDETKIAKIQEDNRNYLNNLNDSFVFLDPNLSKLVTAWNGNLILLGAKTGGGKSSFTANLILSTILQKNPNTNKNRRVLVISNEEAALSVYNRLTCLKEDWDYSEQKEFTQ